MNEFDNQDRLWRRLQNILLHLTDTSNASNKLILQFTNATEGDWVEIGDVRLKLSDPNDSTIVPKGIPPVDSGLHADSPQVQEILQHLKWMMQKELLGQDMFLLGPPGPFRRWLAYRYCEITQREIEYISLSRDTTESDLKQRREVRDRTIIYIDQAAVSAAIHGRVLIIEGMEKCERNVLPVLNNLLENREMRLEDGRFLMRHDRYNHLLSMYSKDYLDSMRLVPVHPRFIVIALGLPVPKYPGNPLDPPLRSRFQARDIKPLSAESELTILGNVYPINNLTLNFLRKLISFSESLRSLEHSGRDLLPKLPHFPNEGIRSILKIIATFNDVSLQSLIERIYPYQLVADAKERDSIEISMKDQNINQNRSANNYPYEIKSIIKQVGTFQITLENTQTRDKIQVDIIGGSSTPNFYQESNPRNRFVELKFHRKLLMDMIQDQYIQKDMCIIGTKGSGKTKIAHKFADIMGYIYPNDIETIQLYKDMSSRDLLQRRVTKENGDTIWENTPLVRACLHGGVAILDGINRLNLGSISVLSRLIHDRDITLLDGTRLVRHDRYDDIMQQQQQRVYKIHPSFRVIALATPPTVKMPWLTSEVMSLFHFHVLPEVGQSEKSIMLYNLFPNLDRTMIDLLLAFDDKVTSMTHQQGDRTEISMNNLSLSLRQMIRICHHISLFPDNLYDLINRTLLMSFRPLSSRDTLDRILNDIGISPNISNSHSDKIEKYTNKNGNEVVRIGDIEYEIPKKENINESLIPSVVFYEVPKHISILKEMLKDWILGEPILLIGNQGVGKNKLVDKLMELLKKEREYIQLHRDTTVQSLTVLPVIKNGVLLWDDSPLVRSVIYGRTLIIDEADKAPLEVVSILKGLIEDKEMLLSDGRKIVPPNYGKVESFSNVIPMHPEFRIVVLANRPGYPFLGNDFFSEIGDCFSCHTVENPDQESELLLLKKYGPNVPDDLLLKLSGLFQDLRELVDLGLLGYPYSLRELVNIVRHLQEFGNSDGLLSTLENVFSFDIYDKQLRDRLSNIFHNHGIPLDLKVNFVEDLAKIEDLPPPVITEKWIPAQNDGIRKIPRHDSIDLVKLADWKYKNGPLHQIKGRLTSRLNKFNELKYAWSVESDGTTISMTTTTATTTTTTPIDDIHVLINDPFQIHTFYGGDYTRYDVIDMNQFIPMFNSDYLTRSNLRYLSSPREDLNLLKPSLIGLLHGKFVLFVPTSYLLLLFDTNDNSVSPINLHGFNDKMLFSVFKSSIFLGPQSSQEFISEKNPPVQVVDQLGKSDDILIFYKRCHPNVTIINFHSGKVNTFKLPNEIAEITHKLHLVSKDQIIFQDISGKTILGGRWVGDFSTLEIHQSFTIQYEENQLNGIVPNSPYLMIHDKSPAQSPIMYLNQSRSYVQFIDKQSKKVNSYLRKDMKEIVKISKYLDRSDILLNIYHHGDNGNDSIELIDMNEKKMRKLEWIQTILPTRRYNRNNISHVSQLINGDIVLLQESGTLIIIEIDINLINRSLMSWRTMVGISNSDGSSGNGGSGSLELKGSKIAKGPKDGKIDPKGERHSGGNTFKGGSGGTDTAGMGGKGGAYRHDSGHEITQISEAEKQQVSEEIKKEARETAKKALAKRLEEIDMSEYESDLYEKYLSEIGTEISTLRVTLEGVEAKSKERTWISNQTSGDFDDRKIIEGITGEKNIFKRRGLQDPQMGSPQEKPKRLRFVMDISGSMYRFNNQDRRLDRLLLSTLLIMEAFHGFDHKYHYSIVGHSGDSPEILLVDYGKPPANRKERLKILKKMKAHSEYCQNGDSTIDAIQLAVANVSSQPADDYFVFAVSDANLKRYGIQSHQISKALSGITTSAIATKSQINDKNEKLNVNGFIIFIASNNNEAEMMKKELPIGRSFVCLDTVKLPGIFHHIFHSSSLFNDNHVKSNL